MKSLLEFMKTKGAKLLLIIFAVFVLLFQTVAFSIAPTNAEVVERVKQAQLLANLSLQKDGNTYIITSPFNFYQLGKYCYDGGSTKNMTFRQDAHIDLGASTGITYYPIGGHGANHKFEGTYNGNGYVLSNYTFNYSSYEWPAVGLFGMVDDGTIQNVTINNINVEVSGSVTSAGVIAGKLSGRGAIQNCFVTNSSVTASNMTEDINLGGIVGSVDSNSARIEKCYSDTNVTATGSRTIKCGGIVGNIDGAGRIEQCMASGDITAGDGSKGTSAYSGGIAGDVKGGATIIDCGAYGQQIDANPKFSQTENTTSTPYSDSDGYLTITKLTKTTTYSQLGYAGGICGSATSSTLKQNFVYKCTIDHGFTEVRTAYNYSTNEFAGLRLYSEAMGVKNSFKYTYYKFNMDITIPSRVENYGGYICGAYSSCTFNKNYQNSNNFFGGTTQDDDELLLSFESKKSDVVKNKTKKPGNTTTNKCNNTFAIQNELDKFALPWYDENGNITEWKQPIGYYCVDGTSTFYFQGNQYISKGKFFEMVLKGTQYAIDENGIDANDNGLKYEIYWGFYYGYGIASYEYELKEIIVDCSDFYNNSSYSGNSYFLSTDSPTKLSSNWSKSSAIYEGYPHLKHFYWEGNLVKPA